jgi:hypothetical protein
MKVEAIKKAEDLMDSATTLSSLAMLKVNIDAGGDYLEYLKPYVLHVLAQNSDGVVSDSAVAKQLREFCGLEIPRRTVQVVLKRIVKDGILERKNGIYCIQGELPATTFLEDKAGAQRHIDFVVEELIKYALEASEREVTHVEATDAIVLFLSYFSIPCLRSFLRGTALPSFGDEGNWKIVLVGQFVGDIANKPQVLDSFMKFVQGHMLANALLCPDLQEIKSTYGDVTFYLDTPVLIRILGLEGQEEKQAIEEVVRLVKRLGGCVKYFSHTLDELTNAIRVSSDFVDSPKGRGSIVQEARRTGTGRSDLILASERAADSLSALGIAVENSPEYSKTNYKFELDESAFGQILDDEINYYNDRARQYDISSVRAIYVLRKGAAPRSLEKSRAVLVTCNTSFSLAAFEYGKSHEQSREVSTVITDFSLANVAWLKSPHGAPSLPQKEVLAFAYAARRPSSDFWSKVLQQADKLESLGGISARDHQLLRSSHSVQSELMKLTLGEDDSLNAESIIKVLDRVCAEIKGESAEEIVAIEQRRAAIARDLESATSQNEETVRRIKEDAERRAKSEASFISILIWCAQISVAVAGIVKLEGNPRFAWVLIVVAVLSSLIRVIGAHWDIKPAKVKERYKDWRMSRIIASEHLRLGIRSQPGA